MRERSTSYCHFGRKPLIQLAAAQSWTLTFVRVTNEGEVHLLSSFRRKPESSFTAPKLDPDFRQGDEENKGAKTFLLTTFLIESSHSSPCSVKEALSGCRFLSVEKGRCL